MILIYNVYITDHIREKFVIQDSLLGKEIKLRLIQVHDEKLLFPNIENADALIVDRVKITDYTLSRIKNCKVIVRFGIGYDGVDIQAAGKRGIYVCNVPDFCIEEVADHTMALILCMARNIVVYNNNLLKGEINNWDVNLDSNNRRLRDKILGLVGYGKISRAVAQRANNFGLKIIFYDPYFSEKIVDKENVRRVKEINELAKNSDIISFHLPLTKDTKHMVNETFFKSVKKGCYLINTSRGGIIDTSALYNAIKNNLVSKAALDVLEDEPINYKEKLLSDWLNDDALKEKLIITPHCAFFSEESFKEIKFKIIEIIKETFSGKIPKNCVNLSYIKGDKD